MELRTTLPQERKVPNLVQWKRLQIRLSYVISFTRPGPQLQPSYPCMRGLSSNNRKYGLGHRTINPRNVPVYVDFSRPD